MHIICRKVARHHKDQALSLQRLNIDYIIVKQYINKVILYSISCQSDSAKQTCKKECYQQKAAPSFIIQESPKYLMPYYLVPWLFQEAQLLLFLFVQAMF